ncbi:MAG: hypothetical protein E6G81_12965 [Alphaproteobacteria bacterium]|nr:MAG: hypothetical protein E6G81_12965 [Alphaproteobacteria bacterium]
MRRWQAVAFALVLLALALPATAQSVLTYHARSDRGGNYAMPEFTWDHARALQLDPGFAPRFDGHLYSQPLYWRPPGAAAGLLIIASESNIVTAIDAATGKTAWTRALGRPASLSAFDCGNIDPLGITGTPVDGAVLPGWPIDVGEALHAAGQDFDSRVQNQRGALLLLDGALYVPYGGFYGDCGDYHGWVVGVKLDDQRHVFAWRTRGRGGGIWAPGGIASDGQALYVATGNTLGARDWADGEAVFRLNPDLRHAERNHDFFAATDWRALDSRDADLGGTNPLPFDLPGGQPVVLALGKDEKAYLLDRYNLGGFGGSLVTERVTAGPIRTAPAVYPAAGAMLVAFQGRGAHCPAGQSGDLTVLRIAAAPRLALQTAWCGVVSGAGSPIVTTTDGNANPIVWMLGAEGDNRLHGFRGDTGEKLFASPPLAGLRHFQTLIAADDRLFVGADGRLYAFGLPH